MGYVSAKSLKDAGASSYVEIFTDVTDYTSGTTTTLTTSETLPSENSVWIYFDGVVQHHSEYSVGGTTINFTSAIPLATANVEVQFNKQVPVGTPGEDTVTHSMLTADNISTLLRKNAIINGNFDIWQRATSQTATGYGSDDRWQNNIVGTTQSVSQQTFTLGQTDVPCNPTYYSRTVVSSVASAGNYAFKYQPIESVSTFAGETVTLSFWAKADATKNIAIEFYQYFGTGGTPSVAVTGIGVTTVGLTTTWQKYTVTTTIPSISGKTLGTNGNDWMAPIFWFDAGTTYDSRTNSLGQQSGTFDIAQVQIEKGSTATDFERRSTGEELALCQRYFERNATDGSSAYAQFSLAIVRASTNSRAHVAFETKRVIPTVSLSGAFRNVVANATKAITANAIIAVTTKTVQISLDHTTTATAGQAGIFTANNDVNAYIDIDAEL